MVKIFKILDNLALLGISQEVMPAEIGSTADNYFLDL
jgi:hypothetical protein